MKYFLGGASLFFLMGAISLAHADTKVCFSPNGDCQDAVIAEISKAHNSIDIAMYSFTSRGIAQALIEAKNKKVKVRVVLDKAQIKDHYSKSRFLIKKGVDVKFHMGTGLMHNKFAVIDGKMVLTGSFNWTVLADKRNSENLLMITDKELAGKYSKQFKELWKQSGVGGFKEDESETEN